jgi:NAD(P)H dehydrogenase (quinone)
MMTKMINKKILITYFSGEGNTEKMSEAIANGAHKSGLKVEIKKVENCCLNDLVEADGIIIGSPTYFSNVAWQVKKLIDESITLYRRNHQLRDKVGGCFTSSGTLRDGEDCIKMMELAFGLHHKLKMIPGIIRESGDDKNEVLKMCQQYGKEIAIKIFEIN